MMYLFAKICLVYWSITFILNTDFSSLYVIKYKYVVFTENCSVKSVLGFTVISLDLGFLTGLSLCLHELRVSALVKKKVCLALMKD